MASVTLSIPADLMHAARSKLGRGGAKVRSYLISSLHALADDCEPLDKRTREALIAGARSGSVPTDDVYWDRKIRRYKQRNGASRSKRRA